MKQAIFTYRGFVNGSFKFADENGREFSFERINNSLIHEHNLKDKKTTGRTFSVKYFSVEKGDKDIYILSDLEAVTTKTKARK